MLAIRIHIRNLDLTETFIDARLKDGGPSCKQDEKQTIANQQLPCNYV